jgi:hypothetical protein
LRGGRAQLVALCAAFALVTPLLGACPSAGGASAATRAPSALLMVQCDVVDATIWVDERPIAQVRDARGGLRLHAGAHRVEIRHDRFHTRYYELELAQGETRTLDVKLVEVLD